MRMDGEALRRAALAHPNDPELFLLLGRRLRQSGQGRKAAVMTRRAYDLSDGAPRFVAAKAGALLDLGDAAAASQLITTAVARTPRSGELRAALARVEIARGAFAEALLEAQTAVQQAPACEETWQALGNALSFNKRPQAAFSAFERAVTLEPGDSELLADYGEALMRYGERKAAAAVLQRSRAAAPRAARPVALLGQLQAAGARTAAERVAARALLELAIARAPQVPDPRYHLALLDLRDRQFNEAVGLLKSCLALDPAYGEAYLALGQAYQYSGRDADARRAFTAWRRFSDYRRESAHLELRLRRTPGDAALTRRLERLRQIYRRPPVLGPRDP